MKPAELLRLLMSRSGDTPTSLAAKVHQRTKQPQIYKYLMGIAREPRRSTLQPVADFYGIPIEALYSEKEAAKVGQQLENSRDSQNIKIVTAELRLNNFAQIADENSSVKSASFLGGFVPVLTTIEAADIQAFFDRPAGSDPEREALFTSVSVGHSTFAMRVPPGDSMEPDFTAGMMLIVEPDMTPAPNDFVLAKSEDQEITFKQLAQDGADWYLKPLNDRYPIKPLGKSTIVGVVRAVERLFR